ncbi:hypothetical protein CcI49_17185 [Frankia sp. CcI49]|uniref:NHL domain-containing protein n=1 Tax=Frankia sp. CcI49 TaxID=1745382 RepID=UPI000977BBA2|nr:TIR domain-containing protein [Frankia sp. CcI49]ONH59205.1 hypothetical protein CcI49_17185 [Frankia sp. CcI49]
MAEPGWDFFVSYTTSDRAWAEWIAWQLEDAGYRVLIQAWDLVPGARWMSRMADGVRDSQRVLAVLSHSYLGSVYGRAEWEAAHQQDPDGFARKVVPVRVQDCPRPVLLGGVVSFDLFDLPADQARDRLLDNIRSTLAGRAKPVSEPRFPGTLVPPTSAVPHRITELIPAFPGAEPDTNPDIDVHLSARSAPAHSRSPAPRPPEGRHLQPHDRASPPHRPRVTNRRRRRYWWIATALATALAAASLPLVLNRDSGQLASPRGVAVGPDGTVYVADSGYNLVEQVDNTSEGLFNVAGNGSGGFSGDGDRATEATLNTPSGIAVGPDGAVYIAGSGNHRIRKVDPSGKVSTVAGTGIGGFSGDDGPATKVMLNYPLGVAVGPGGAVYIADSGNEQVRKVDLSGRISTIAGTDGEGFSGDDGPATEATLNYPHGVAVSGDGAVYIADTGNDRVRKVDLSGRISTIAGTGTEGFSGDDGLATKAMLNTPSGIAVGPDGAVYIADTGNHWVRKVDPFGKISTVAWL